MGLVMVVVVDVEVEVVVVVMGVEEGHESNSKDHKTHQTVFGTTRHQVV
jgi:hypothetical protein